MILAAGRGERMRPLSDTTPKPLLEAGGKPLIVWQIEALARAGFRDIVVNVSHLADRFVAALGDGAALGVTLRWSIEPEPLEVAGGIATALPLLPRGTGVDRLRRRLHVVRLRFAPAAGDGDGTRGIRRPRPSRAGTESPLPPGRRFRARRRPRRARAAARVTPMRVSASTIRTLFRELPRGDEAQTSALPPTVDSRRPGFRRNFRRRVGQRRYAGRSRRARCRIAASRKRRAQSRRFDAHELAGGPPPMTP